MIIIIIGIGAGLFAANKLPGKSISTPQQTSSTNTVKNNEYYFSVDIPSSWTPVVQETQTPGLFQYKASDGSLFELLVRDLPSGTTLDQYLSEQDQIAQTANNGQPSKNILSTTTVSPSALSGVERREEFLAAGLTGVVDYFTGSDRVYSLSFVPGPDNNIDASQVFKEHQNILTTFAILPTTPPSANATPVPYVPGPADQITPSETPTPTEGIISTP